jgi:hypothetical protein
VDPMKKLKHGDAADGIDTGLDAGGGAVDDQCLCLRSVVYWTGSDFRRLASNLPQHCCLEH